MKQPGRRIRMREADIDRFVAALIDRHAGPLRRSEFLKAIRALSARYVERRGALSSRSPLDSAGKRAAFAAYYAPCHFLIASAILKALRGDSTKRSREVHRIIDLGCGTGAAGAAWAGSVAGRVTIQGVDQSGWAIAEAAWTYRTLKLRGRATRGDLVRSVTSLAARNSRETMAGTGVALAWSVNELPDKARQTVRDALLEIGKRDAAVLVVEPVSRRAAPWFEEWAGVFSRAGGREDTWRFEAALPPALVEVAGAAGLGHEALTARSLSINLP